MKELIFNDARSLEVQSVSVAREGVIHIRAILVTSEPYGKRNLRELRSVIVS